MELIEQQLKNSYTRFVFKGPVVQGYDAFNRITTVGYDVQWRKRTAEYAAYSLVKNERPRVLDLACGTGDMAIALKNVCPDMTIIGTEPSDEMIAKAREKLSCHKNKFKPLRAVTHLPFRDASFDAITIAFGVRNFIGLEQHVRECYRLLKPDGKLYVLEFFQPESKLIASFLAIYQRIAFPVIGYMLTGHVSQYRYLYRSILGFKSLKEFRKILKVRFRNIKAHPMFCGLVHLVIANKEKI